MKLFLGDKCWDKLFELPKNVQLRVRDFQRKFKENPRSAAINLEKIQDFRDSSLRTARIDDTYRAIIGVASDDIESTLMSTRDSSAGNSEKRSRQTSN